MWSAQTAAQTALKSAIFEVNSSVPWSWRKGRFDSGLLFRPSTESVGKHRLTRDRDSIVVERIWSILGLKSDNYRRFWCQLLLLRRASFFVFSFFCGVSRDKVVEAEGKAERQINRRGGGAQRLDYLCIAAFEPVLVALALGLTGSCLMQRALCRGNLL